MDIDVAILVRAYDALHPGHWWSYPPTSRSLRRIRKTLSIVLPSSLVAFARESSACSRWLASLGEDFDSPLHILHVHSRVSRIRRRRIGGGGAWEYVKPAGFVPFTHGYDSDFDCLDTSERNEEPDEFPIQYWSPPRILGELRYPSFPEYMYSTIRYWEANTRGPLGKRALGILAESPRGRA